MMNAAQNAINEIKPRLRGFFPVRPLFGGKQKNDGGRYESNEKTSFSIHPLFFLTGIFYSLIGQLPLFLMSVIIALEHELAHAFCAARLGYRLNKIVLMPYGAVIDGDLKELVLKDEVAVALAGPICNLLTAAAFAALWWFYPTAYAYTDTACFLSLSIALVNLLPAYPLDGGRVLKCVLSAWLLRSKAANKGDAQSAEEKAEKICRILSLIISLSLLLAFAVMVRRGVQNYTVLAFALFLATGSLPTKQSAVYTKINFSNLSALERGMEIRRVAVLQNTRVKSALRYLCRGKYLILEVYDLQENYLGEIRQSELSELFASASAYSEMSEILQKRVKMSEKCQKYAENAKKTLKTDKNSLPNL